MDKNSLCLVASGSGEQPAESGQITIVVAASAVFTAISTNLVLACIPGTPQYFVVNGIQAIQPFLGLIPGCAGLVFMLSLLSALYAGYCIYRAIRAGPDK